ncbi:hypothetical protein KL933_001977 [Ogataea haglerorum]|uniref:Ubiquitin-like protease family profile domain-containing protein n=1 Tax=Ogataea haglerorum TaxID=1937702 RepID=A0AAN6I252_9ASCO|nr:hypothetical protein KL933_001977 [Ogataea haglerorum]
MPDFNDINVKTRGERRASDETNFLASGRDFSMFSRLPSSAPSFTYSNLPSFRNSSSLYEPRQLSTNSNTGSLPFVPRESMLNDKFVPSPRIASFPQRPAFESKTINPQKLAKPVKRDSTAPETDIIDFLRCLFIILFELGKKTALWAVFFLSVGGKHLMRLIERIPLPETARKVERTPTKRDIDGITELFNKLVPASVSTPLEGSEVKQVDDSIADSRKSKIGQLASKLDESKNSPARDYGTFFYKPKNVRPNVNIEAMFLKSNFGRTEDYKEHKPYDPDSELRSRASQLTSSIKKMFPLEEDRKRDRRASRFRDLEWLKKDHVDYVENLESTELFMEYQKIMQERTKMQELIKLTKSRDYAKVRPLSADQLATVEKFWKSSNPRLLVSSAFNIDIYTRDLKTLCDRKWLNDNVIDFYMGLINERAKSHPTTLPQIHIFSTHFYSNLSTRGYNSVRRWTKRAKVDVTKLDYIFVPINLNQSHWALGVINNKERAFQYYDSLYGNGDDILYNLEDYMVNETKKLYGDSMNGIDYSLYDHFDSMKTPKQENGFDCGVFMCTVVDYVSRERPLLFSQSDMKNLRRRMAYEICTKKLIDH